MVANERDDGNDEGGGSAEKIEEIKMIFISFR